MNPRFEKKHLINILDGRYCGRLYRLGLSKFAVSLDTPAQLSQQTQLSDTTFLAIFTGTWVVLGGVFQTGVAVFLTCKGEPDGPFKSLPVLIRILVIVTAPFLLSPFILNIYGAYTVIRYGQDNEAKKIAALRNDLKMAETIVESVPQIVTQCISLRLLSELKPVDSIWEHREVRFDILLS